jgi:hypothetical protein
MEAFRKSSGGTLFAVARPHHAVRTGETVRFDVTATTTAAGFSVTQKLKVIVER